VRITTSGEWLVGEDRFGGDLIAQRAKWGGITLVNLVDLELYLRGVVPWEIGRPEEAALEAVKAQAIAARTYTIRHLGRWEELGFDVYSDVRDQVYRGLTGTAPITDRAVRETRNLIVSHASELVRAYYSSTCGGHTSTLTDVWDREGAPYLRGFRDADDRGRSWCAKSPHFRWTEAWSARELGGVLRSYLGDELDEELAPEDFGVLQGLSVLERDASGRVSRLQVRTDRGEWVVWGDRIRWALRPVHSRFAILRSTMFEVEEQTRDGALSRVLLRGGGFGHGVGLCQTGALERAREGQSAREILEAYYSGATVRDRHARPGPS
jgi:stage II sporulation protein D